MPASISCKDVRNVMCRDNASWDAKLQSPSASTGIRFEDLDAHKGESCLGRLQECEKCKEMVRKDGLTQHDQEECEERDRPCTQDNCHWVGPHSQKEFHELRCPWNTTQCEICLEKMYEWEMQIHKCPLVDGAEQCICCTEYLWTKPVAQLLKLGRTTASLTCAHFIMCVPCAEKVRWAELDTKTNRGEITDTHARKPRKGSLYFSPIIV